MSYSIKNILCATEIELRSPEVFRHAVGIAQQFDAKLHALTVFQSREMPLVTDFISHEKLDEIHADSVEQLRAEFEKSIESFHRANPDLDARRVIASVQVLEGNAAQAILTSAKRLGADLIVLGSHGHSALGEILMGSVAHKVTVTSDVPILLVPINH